MYQALTIERILIAITLCALSARALELQFAGVVGNSGEGGAMTIRSAVGKGGGGVAVDIKGRVLVSGGDRILALNRQGHRLWETPLPKPDWVVGGDSFALADGHLYFFAGPPQEHRPGNPWTWQEVYFNLCRVAVSPEAKAEVVASATALKYYNSLVTGRWFLTAGANRAYLGRIFSALYSSGLYAKDAHDFSEILPDGTLRALFDDIPFGRVSADEDGAFYLSGVIQGKGGVHKVDREGRDLPAFPPAPRPALAPPYGWEGKLMLTKNAIWDAGNNGFVGRFTRDLKLDPGAVVSCQYTLRCVAQIVDAPNGRLYIKSHDALYLAAYENGQLKLLKRFGSLPLVQMLMVTRNGYIGIGNPENPGMMWFDFGADDPAQPPLRTDWAEYTGPTCQGYLDRGLGMVAFAPDPRDTGKILLGWYRPEPYSDTAPAGVGVSGAWSRPLAAAARAGAYVFACDRQNRRLLRAPLGAPFKLEEAGGYTPSSLAALGSNLLVMANANRLEAFVVEADGTLKRCWELRRDFGQELYVATSANLLWVADTRRHRALLFACATMLEQPPVFAAQFGETDQPGDSLDRLQAPTLVSLCEGKAVVYDSGNQRVVKLRIR